MKDFKVLHYLRRWRILIFVSAMIAGILFYLYGKESQVYTASSVIEFDHEGIEEGLAPDGTELDVSQIFSSNVITKALEETGANASVDWVRTHGSTAEIVPDDVQQAINAKIEEGKDYEPYYPTQYKVSFSVESDRDEEFARTMLDTVLDCYVSQFSEQYINQSLAANGVETLGERDYDYIEKAEVINDSVADILTYLNEKAKQDYTFRSSHTGYTFTDLAALYDYIHGNEVPYLFSRILQGRITQDQDLLIKKYQTRIDQHNQTATINNSTVQDILDIIQTYASKNQEGGLYYDGENQGTGNSSGVLDDVYGMDEENLTDHTTVYDTLLDRFVNEKQGANKQSINAAYCQYIIDIFQTQPEVEIDQTQYIQDIEGTTTTLIDKLNELYQIVDDTVNEYNDYLGAQNIKVVASTSVTSAVNTKLYAVLGAVLFLVVGCIGAIVLGRGEEMIEYFFYTDATVDLPNKGSCDNYIHKREDETLPDNMTCLIFEVRNIRDINIACGRKMGDELLRFCSTRLKSDIGKYSFLGYNGNQQFIMFIEGMSKKQVNASLRFVEDRMMEFVNGVLHQSVSYRAGVSCSGEDDVYQIRGLLSKAASSMENVEATYAAEDTEEKTTGGHGRHS